MIQLAAPQLGERERARVESVLDSGQLASGTEVDSFESEFAAYLGRDHAVATSNGTTALHAALHALGIGPGDRVLTTPFSFVASTNAIRLAGAEPVFADIDLESFNLDPRAAAETIRTDGSIDAILVVHLFGQPAEMDYFADLAAEYDLQLIEDAAQAHGAKFDHQHVGTVGDVACFSFYPTKNMTTGEGGMVVTDRDDVARRAARFINHGEAADGDHVEVGHNFRLTDLAAAIGRVQLERLPEFVECRRSNADQLTYLLRETPVVTPSSSAWVSHAYNQYTIRCDDRDRLRDHLAEHGIESGVYYPRPIHRQPAYRDHQVSLPVAERAAKEVLSLPVHPGLTSANIREIARAIWSFQPPDSGRHEDIHPAEWQHPPEQP
jgi:perosamine synthetase